MADANAADACSNLQPSGHRASIILAIEFDRVFFTLAFLLHLFDCISELGPHVLKDLCVCTLLMKQGFMLGQPWAILKLY